MPPSLFKVGDIVMVDDTNKAYIIDVRGERHDLFCKLQFIVGRNEETNVSQNQCRVVPIFYATPSTQGTQFQRNFT